MDARPHIGDPNSVISQLGGKALYGQHSSASVPIRELVANALDATRALRLAFEEAEVRPIVVEFADDGEYDVVSIQDFGLGSRVAGWRCAEALTCGDGDGGMVLFHALTGFCSRVTGVAFMRRVRTASGATAVQIAEYVRGRQRIVEHVGSAHTEAELGILLQRARELLDNPAQGVLELGAEPTPPVKGLIVAAGPGLFEAAGAVTPAGRDGPGRVVGTDSRILFDALATVLTALGFDGLGHETRCSGTW